MVFDKSSGVDLEIYQEIFEAFIILLVSRNPEPLLLMESLINAADMIGSGVVIAGSSNDTVFHLRCPSAIAKDIQEAVQSVYSLELDDFDIRIATYAEAENRIAKGNDAEATITWCGEEMAL